MGNEVLTREMRQFLNDSKMVKVLVTTDDDGLPHPAVKESLHAEGDSIVYLEFLESSLTNRYMTRALWFDKPVVILLLTEDKRSFKITAKPVRAVVNTKLFQRYYEEADAEYGRDLAAAWVLEPVKIVEETLNKRAAEEAESRSYFHHLDRFAVNN